MNNQIMTKRKYTNEYRVLATLKDSGFRVSLTIEANNQWEAVLIFNLEMNYEFSKYYGQDEYEIDDVIEVNTDTQGPATL